jgi:hypothetical protein
LRDVSIACIRDVVAPHPAERRHEVMLKMHALASRSLASLFAATYVLMKSAENAATVGTSFGFGDGASIEVLS